jgi:Zn ribbon nucleic-acid-binding protein
MIFVCSHCGREEFQLWAGIDGIPTAQCLNCGEAERLDQSKLPEPLAREHAEAARSEK